MNEQITFIRFDSVILSLSLSRYYSANCRGELFDIQLS